MSYKFIEDLSLADVAFVASGKTLNEMLKSAALAVTNTMVKDLKSVKSKVEKNFVVEASDPENLLFKFLQEIIFYKDAESLLLSNFTLKTKKDGKDYRLSVKAKGEKINMKKHDLSVDVKAVTFHMFEVKGTRAGWKARVILDI
ncbi:MAG TPA: archease [archaeon]|nr:archease [archaeon]